MTTTPVLTRQMAERLLEAGVLPDIFEALRAIADGRARVQVQCDHVGPSSGRQYTHEDCAVCHGTGWTLAP